MIVHVLFQRNFDFGSNNLTNGLDTSSTSKQTEDLQDIFKLNIPEKSTKKLETKPLNLREKQKYMKSYFHQSITLLEKYNKKFISYSLSKQNELHQRLQTEPVIAPTQITSAKPKALPKDLTSTLINSNLEDLKLTPTPKPTPNVPLQMPQPIQGNLNSFANSYKPQFAANPMPVFNNTFPVQNPSMNSAGLSPAAFFTNNLADNINLQAAMKPKPAKPLTSSEINDFLNWDKRSDNSFT